MKAAKYVVSLILKEIAHRSYSNPIKSGEIEAMLNVSGPQVRTIVREARREKKMLIVSGERGYYTARDYNEYKEAMHHFIARADSIIKTDKILRDHYAPFDKQQSMF